MSQLDIRSYVNGKYTVGIRTWINSGVKRTLMSVLREGKFKFCGVEWMETDGCLDRHMKRGKRSVAV